MHELAEAPAAIASRQSTRAATWRVMARWVPRVCATCVVWCGEGVRVQASEVGGVFGAWERERSVQRLGWRDGVRKGCGCRLFRVDRGA